MKWRETEWNTDTVRRAVREWSKGGGCGSPKYEGGRQLPFTAGLACFLLGSAEARVGTEWNETDMMKEWHKDPVLLVRQE